MPWKEVRPMDEKGLFIADYLRETDCFSHLCERYGVRRIAVLQMTSYRHLGRTGAPGQTPPLGHFHYGGDSNGVTNLLRLNFGCAATVASQD